MISLQEQITEARRELGVRKSVYPKLIQRGRMTEDQAEYHITVMQAIVETLTRLEDAQRQLPLLRDDNPWDEM